MEKLLLFGTLCLMVLFAGCIETGPTTEGQEAGEEMEEEQEEEEETTQEPPEDQVDLEDLTYLELAALGVPIQCDVTVTSGTETQTMKMYMQGETRLRYEYTFGTYDMVTIMRDDTTYFTNMMADEYPDCEWFVIEAVEEEEETEPSQMDVSVEAEDFEDLPSTSFECSVWVYDDSMMMPPPTATTCTMDEWMDILMAEYEMPEE